VTDYENYIKGHGFYREGQPKVAIVKLPVDLPAYIPGHIPVILFISIPDVRGYLDRYDFVLGFGMGLRMTAGQREQLQKAADKGSIPDVRGYISLGDTIQVTNIIFRIRSCININRSSFIGRNDPFSGNRDNIDSLIVSFQHAGLNVYPISSYMKRLAFLKEIRHRQ